MEIFLSGLPMANHAYTILKIYLLTGISICIMQAAGHFVKPCYIYLHMEKCNKGGAIPLTADYSCYGRQARTPIPCRASA